MSRLLRLSIMLPIVAGTAALVLACAGTPASSAVPAATTAAAPAGSPTAAPTPSPTSTPSPTPVTQTVLKVSQNPKLGSLLTDAAGMTLYTFKNDAPDQSNCTGDCAKTWLPLTVPQGVTPVAAGALSGNIGVLERADGTYQVTFNDMPVYRYSQDSQPGDTNGNGFAGQWFAVILAPATTATVPATSSAIDWTTHGFPKVLATQEIINNTGATVAAGPYSIFVPVGAFTVTVKFVVLGGAPAAFKAQAPEGETPILAFAFDVRDAKTNELISKFDQPVVVTATDKNIVEDSGYYNVDAGGTWQLNLTGIQVQAGELTHPIAGATVGWVITAPTSQAAPTPTPAGSGK